MAREVNKMMCGFIPLLKKTCTMKTTFIIILFFISLCGSAQNALQNYLEVASANNPALKARFNEYYAALEKVPQVKALPDPTIAFGYFLLPVETKNGPQQAKISANQMFPWFGTLKAQGNVAELNAKAKYEAFEETRSKLHYDIKSSYYKLFFTHKAIAITNDNLKLLQTFKNLSQIKVESGSTSAVDMYRAEMEFNDLENQLVLLKDQLWVQQVKFNKLLNVPSEQAIFLPDSLEVVVSDITKLSFLDSIRLNNNVLSGFDYQIEGLQEKKAVASMYGMPKFSVGIDYTFIGSGAGSLPSAGQDAFMFPQIGIVIPIYRSKYNAMVNEVAFDIAAKELEKVDKANSLEVLFETVWKDYQDASRRIQLYTTQTDLASKSLSILETDYMSNNRNFEEILTMERKLLKFKLEAQRAIADNLTAVAFMSYLKGE